MTRTTNEDRGDEVLATVARLAPPAPTDDPAVASALADLVAGAPEQARAERLAVAARRRRLNRRAALSVAAVVAVAGTAAAGWTGFARTGWFGSPGMTENDTSEWIDLTAPDLRPTVDGIVARDLPLPDGVTRADGIDWVARPGHDGLMQATGLRRDYEAWARCSWLTAWDRAHARSDAAAARRASEVLERSVTWPATAATDGGGVTESLRGMVAAARAGNPGPVRRELDLNCPPPGEFKEIR